LLVIRRRRRRAKLPPELRVTRRSRDRSTVAEIYDGVAKQLAKAGFPRTSATTPRELAGKLGEHPAAGRVGELVELYYAAEWGGRRDAAVEDRAEALAAQIKQTLREVAKTKKAS
jgi:hypothetical protein